MSDYNLKQNLAKIKDKPFNFALIEGKKMDMVLVTPKPAPGKLLDDTKRECGDGKRVAKGICLRENGMLVFATRSAPVAAWKVTLKKIFQEQKCSMFLPIELRQLGDHESEEVVTEVVEGESKETEAEQEPTAQSNPPQQSPPPPSKPPAPTQPKATAPPTQQAPPPQSAPKPPSPPSAPKPPQSVPHAPPAPTAPQPTQTAKPAPPPPPAPLAPDAEPLFKKRYQNCLYAELKVPAAQAQLKEQLKSLMAQAKGLGDQHHFVEGNKKLDEVEALLKAPAHDSTHPPTNAPSTETAAALGGWQTARSEVVGQLRKLGSAIVAAKDPESGPAQIVLEAIAKNLTEKPATLQQVLELERYLQTDDIITEAESPNPFGVTITIRTPLLNALGMLKKHTV